MAKKATKAGRPRGRPATYTPATQVRVAPRGGVRLQSGSDRRVIVDFLIEQGGVATIETINDYFTLDMTDKVAALVRLGWLEIYGGEA